MAAPADTSLLSEAHWGLIGVFIGFALSSGFEWFKAKKRRKQLAVALRSEMSASLQMIPQKQHIVDQAIDALAKLAILPMAAVRFPSTIYSSHFAELAAHYAPLSRNSLHVIYESQRIFDETCEELAKQASAAGNAEEMKLVLRNYKARLPDMKTNLVVIEKLLVKHLEGDPIDVLHTKLSREDVRKRIVPLPTA